MRDCVIHVGMPKAGSTTLQHFLMRHRRQLRAEGLLVPTMGGHQSPGHRALSLSLAAPDGDFERSFLPQLEPALKRKRCRSLLLSYEGLQNLHPGLRAPERLVAGFGRIGFRVTFVAVVRPQPLFLNSFYCHEVYWFRSSRRFGAYAARRLRDARFDYGRRLAQWSDCPGARFRALPLTQAGGGSLVERFLEATGLPSPGPEAAAPPLRNERVGVRTLELLRRLTRQGGRYRLDRRLGTTRNWLLAECAARGWQEERFMGLDTALVEAIRERFAAANQAFAARHFAQDWETTFARDYAADYRRNEFDAAAADPRDEAEIDALAAEVLARFGRPWPEALAGGLRLGLAESRRLLARRLPAL